MILKSLFWQTVNSIIKICLELFVFDRKIRRILKGNWAKFYLRKYVNKGVKGVKEVNKGANDGKKSNSSASEKQFYIYQYWESPDGSIPPLVQACLNSVDRYKGDKQRIMLNPDNLNDYVKIPQIFLDLKKQGIIKTAFFSDILRTCLLIQNGGIWIDATVLLTKELPDYITNADLFVFQNDLKIDLDGLNMASYFIASKPGNIILKQTLKALESYWKENRFLVNYFTFLHTFTMVTQKNKELFKKVPFFSFLPVQLLQGELLNKYDPKRWEQIKSMSGIHKLTHKQSVLTKKKDIDLTGTLYEHILEEFK